MSFFSDLFSGNFDNLGKDIVDAPSSLANNPTQLAETLGVVGLGVGGALGLGALAGEGGLFGAGAAADASALGGAALTDVGALSTPIAGADALGAAGAAADASIAGAVPGAADALAFAPTTADALAPIDAAVADTSALSFAPADTAGTAVADTASLPASSPSAISGIDPLSETPYSAGTGSSAASTGGGVTDTLKGIMSSPYTKLAAGLAPLGIALGMGNPSLPGQLGPAAANAAALASQGSALNPAQTASLTQMRQDAVNAARQALFNQGVQNPEADTRWAQMTSNIDSQVTAAAQTMIQQNIQNSLAGDQQLIAIARLQMQSDQNFANMLLNATKSLGTAFGLGSGITLKVA